MKCIAFTWSWIFLFSTITVELSGQIQLEGDFMQWHKITMLVVGDSTSETATPNPFLDYRLVVVFTSQNSGTEFFVPGYYAADGNAANTGRVEGNIWHVHFTPNEVGDWRYHIHFRKGNELAIDPDLDLGIPLEMDGHTGTFTILASDKSGRDLRGKGVLKNVGERYLQFEGDKSWFLKVGADAPENTLAFTDFDDTPNHGNFRKSWSSHLMDYDSVSAFKYLWDDHSKGKGLLGAIRYLSNVGVNAFSFLTFSLAGDDKNVFPHLLKSSVEQFENMNNTAQWRDGVFHDRFDVSKLAQWEKTFEFADQMGMFLHFKTMETENNKIMDNAALGLERKLYYRELIARFGHHLALNWNISEEITLDQSVIADIAGYIKEIDPYQHPVVFHTYPNEDNRYQEFITTDLGVDGASLQVGFPTLIHDKVLNLVQLQRASNRGFIICNDEQGPANVGVDVDPDDRGLVRKEVVYGSIMAGGAGVEFYYGYQTGCSDLDCDNHRTRELKYKDAVLAMQIFENNIPYQLMAPADSIISGNQNYALSYPDSIYLFYLKNGGEATIDVSSNEYTFSGVWLNPRNGSMLEDDKLVHIEWAENLAIGPPPNSQENDWLLLLRRDDVSADIAPIRKVDDSIQVVPNPTSDTITIFFTDDISSFEILDLNGRFMKKSDAHAQVFIDVSDWPEGRYVVHGITGNGITVSTIFIKTRK